MSEGNIHPGLLVKVTLLAAVIGAIGTIVAALIGILPDILKPETSPAFTPTETIAAWVTSTVLEISPTTESNVPVATPKPTMTLQPTSTLLPSNDLQMYDTFDDPCISRSKWGMFVDSRAKPMFLPTPSGQCWELVPGFSTGNGQLTFSFTTATDQTQSFSLVKVSEQTIVAIAMDLAIESAGGQSVGVGLFTRLNDADRSWIYYYLHFGGDLSIGQGRVVFEDSSGQKTEGETIFSLPARARLELRWDGKEMQFYLNGNPALPSVPFSGFSDTFGIYWHAEADSSLQGSIDQFLVAWK